MVDLLWHFISVCGFVEGNFCNIFRNPRLFCGAYCCFFCWFQKGFISVFWFKVFSFRSNLTRDNCIWNFEFGAISFWLILKWDFALSRVPLQRYLCSFIKWFSSLLRDLFFESSKYSYSYNVDLYKTLDIISHVF